MNKKIASEIAIGIILLVATGFGFMIYILGKSEKNEVRLEGKITDVDLGCYSDGVNAIEIDNKLWVTISSPCGLMPPDEPRKEAYCGDLPEDITDGLIGSKIQLYAEKQYSDDSTIFKKLENGLTVCGYKKHFKKYYIRIIDEKKDAMACPEDARLCPDGSYVSRTGQNCEFAECPAEEKQVNIIENEKEKEGKVIKKSEGFNIYSNEYYSFEILYSSDRIFDSNCDGGRPLDCFNFYTKEEYSEHQDALQNPAPVSGPSLSVAVFDSKGKTNVWEWFISEWDGVSESARRIINVDGVEGEKIRMQGAYALNEGFDTAYVIKGEYVFQIESSSEESLDKTLKDFKFLK